MATFSESFRNQFMYVQVFAIQCKSYRSFQGLQSQNFEMNMILLWRCPLFIGSVFRGLVAEIITVFPPFITEFVWWCFSLSASLRAAGSLCQGSGCPGLWTEAVSDPNGSQQL